MAELLPRGISKELTSRRVQMSKTSSLVKVLPSLRVPQMKPVTFLARSASSSLSSLGFDSWRVSRSAQAWGFVSLGWGSWKLGWKRWKLRWRIEVETELAGDDETKIETVLGGG